MAKWIWNNQNFLEDSYVEFVFDIEYQEKEVEMLIGVVNNYALFINNQFIDSNAYHSYPYAPTLDKLNIKLSKGLNRFRIIVYNSGFENCMFFYKDVPGLYFIIKDGERIIKESDENVLSALSNEYLSEHKVQIDGQMGYKEFIDLTKEEPKYQPSVEVSKDINFKLRPNKKCLLLGRTKTTIIQDKPGFYLIDTGKENVGFLDFDIDSSEGQNIVISFGEHIVDGEVRRKIHGRDFSFDVRLKKGNNKFLSVLKRIGARYLQINYQSPIKVNYLGLNEVQYPFVIKPRKFNNELDQRIYDTAVHTLLCCYHEHFEDCPWREQALYTLDSRLQMLAHYYCFDNIEAVNSSIELMLNDWRKDGQLSICFPTKADFVIPSYSLYLFDIIWENYQHTNNLQLLKKSNDKLDSIIEAFKANMENGLVKRFQKDCYWNFYEWVEGYEGYTPVNSNNDSMINLLFLNSLIIKNNINKVLKIDKDFSLEIKELKENILKEFYNKDRKMIDFYRNGSMFSALINSLAIMLDVVPSKEETIEHILNDKDVAKPTLAMKYFLYESLLQTNKSYEQYVLNDIRETYQAMLDDGATSFYETALGEKDFEGAGSLCHGWSGAIPIYFYNVLDVLKAK